MQRRKNATKIVEFLVFLDAKTPQNMRVLDQNGGVSFAVRVTPRANRDAIDGEFDDGRGGALKVRVTAPPAEGQANEAVRRLLAERLNVGVSAVRILAGERSRTKRVFISGVTSARVRSLGEPSDDKGQNKGSTKGGKNNAQH